MVGSNLRTWLGSFRTSDACDRVSCRAVAFGHIAVVLRNTGAALIARSTKPRIYARTAHKMVPKGITAREVESTAVLGRLRRAAAEYT